MKKTTSKKTTSLVIGGCGFIGSHLVKASLKRGHKVRILDEIPTGKRDNLAMVSSQDIEVLIGDVADFKTVEASVQGCEYVFYEAAIVSVPKSTNDPIGTGKVNHEGTLNVLEAARQHGVRRVVFAGGAATYGDESTLPKIESMPANPMVEVNQ